MPQCRPFVMLATLLTLGLMCVGRAAPADGSIDVIVVLAGGVGDDGVPHATVMRRLEHAAQLYKRQMESSHGKAPAIVCNGGGTTHKPKYVDAAGYSIPEAALMGKQLRSMGVSAEHIYVEGYSDDTIGNAFFVRVMHLDARPEWRNVVIITSEFQMERTRAIYGWVLGLTPLPAGKPSYQLSFEAVEDKGALPPRVLRSRREREAASLQTFQTGALVKLTQLADLHRFINLKHSGYTYNGMLSKKPLDRGSALAQTY